MCSLRRQIVNDYARDFDIKAASARDAWAVLDDDADEDWKRWWSSFDKSSLTYELNDPDSEAYQKLQGRLFLIAGTHTTVAMKRRHELGLVDRPMLREVHIIERSKWPDSAFAWFGGQENEKHQSQVKHRHRESYYDFLKIFRQLWEEAGRPVLTIGRAARFSPYGKWKSLCASRFTGVLIKEHDMRNDTDFFTWATKDDAVWNKLDQVRIFHFCHFSNCVSHAI